MKKIIALFVFGSASLLFSGSASVSGYYASSKSTIYHLPGCTWAKKIGKENLIVFPSKEEAQKKGYRACKVCKP